MFELWKSHGFSVFSLIWCNCLNDQTVIHNSRASQTKKQTNRSSNVQINELNKKRGKVFGASGDADTRKEIRSPEATQQTL